MRYVLAVMMTVFMTASAHASSCGPQVEISVDNGFSRGSESGYPGHTHRERESSIGISLIFGLGDDKCEEQAAADLHSTRISNRQDKADLLAQKLEICEDFTRATAPNSIRRYLWRSTELRKVQSMFKQMYSRSYRYHVLCLCRKRSDCYCTWYHPVLRQGRTH